MGRSLLRRHDIARVTHRGATARVYERDYVEDADSGQVVLFREDDRQSGAEEHPHHVEERRVGAVVAAAVLISHGNLEAVDPSYSLLLAVFPVVDNAKPVQSTVHPVRVDDITLYVVVVVKLPVPVFHVICPHAIIHGAGLGVGSVLAVNDIRSSILSLAMTHPLVKLTLVFTPILIFHLSVPVGFARLLVCSSLVLVLKSTWLVEPMLTEWLHTVRWNRSGRLHGQLHIHVDIRFLVVVGNVVHILLICIHERQELFGRDHRKVIWLLDWLKSVLLRRCNHRELELLVRSLLL